MPSSAASDSGVAGPWAASAAPGDVLVQVEVALTDGTDLKAFRRGHPVLLGELPSPFGHEFCGIDVATGRRVVAANSAATDERGAPLELLNGAYAELLVVPRAIAEVNLLPVPPGLEPEVALSAREYALLEALADRPGAYLTRAQLEERLYGWDELHPLQAEAMTHVMAGHDTLLVAPTGFGKSAVYQVPAVLLDGPTVVVSPLLSRATVTRARPGQGCPSRRCSPPRPPSAWSARTPPGPPSPSWRSSA